jgi:hypothetical protein
MGRNGTALPFYDYSKYSVVVVPSVCGVPVDRIARKEALCCTKLVMKARCKERHAYIVVFYCPFLRLRTYVRVWIGFVWLWVETDGRLL